eukprot:6499318-Pyramimonas_sp.AAC.1
MTFNTAARNLMDPITSGEGKTYFRFPPDGQQICHTFPFHLSTLIKGTRCRRCGGCGRECGHLLNAQAWMYLTCKNP